MTNSNEDNTLRVDDNEELNALTLTTLLNSGVDEAMTRIASLSPAELIELERKVLNLQQRQKHSPGAKAEDASAEDTHRRRSAASTPQPEHMSGEPGMDGGDAMLAATALGHMPAGTHVLSMDRPRPTGGQYMNLPASTPHVEFREGMEWLIFTYSTKGHIQEYHIRADIDDIALEDIPDDFKRENCVYPRALVSREEYVGNRYDYERIVNDIAWRLCWRNPGILNSKRGLIQRAVDSYRNRTSENRSRRVQRQEKLQSQSPYSKALAAGMVDPVTDPQLAASLAASGLTLGAHGMSSVPQHMSVIRVPGPKTLTLQYADRDGEPAKIKIRVDVDGVDLAQIDDDFRANNAVFPDAHAHALAGTVPPNTTPDQWAYEHACNELGWKLAWLNSAKLAGKRSLLHKAVEAYHARMEAAERARQAVLQHHSMQGYAPGTQGGMGYDPAAAAAAAAMMYHQGAFDASLVDSKAGSDDFGHLVAQTLQQAIAQGGVMPPHGVSGAYGGQQMLYGAHGLMLHGAHGMDGSSLPPLDPAALQQMQQQMEHHAALQNQAENGGAFYGLPNIGEDDSKADDE